MECIKEKVYNVLIFVLSILSVSFAIIDFSTGLNQMQIWTDRIIYIIFVLDYIVRLIIAEKRNEFIRKNILIKEAEK